MLDEAQLPFRIWFPGRFEEWKKNEDSYNKRYLSRQKVFIDPA